MYRNMKNNVYPCKTQFYYIKVGLMGSKLYRYVFVMFSQHGVVRVVRSSRDEMPSFCAVAKE